MFTIKRNAFTGYQILILKQTDGRALPTFDLQMWIDDWLFLPVALGGDVDLQVDLALGGVNLAEDLDLRCGS